MGTGAGDVEKGSLQQDLEEGPELTRQTEWSGRGRLVTSAMWSHSSGRLTATTGWPTPRG